MKITVVGAGPAGSWTSILLAKRGHAVTLLDSQAPWEKPCGGGITAKALSAFDIFNSDLPRQYIDRITIYFADKVAVSVSPQQPLAVVSRRELGSHLLEEALRAGVSFVKTRVSQIAPMGRGWLLTTRESELHADFLIGADGAASLVRRSVGKGLEPKDLCVTLGYIIQGNVTTHMKIFFVPDFQGYLWSFPRTHHISYGLITRSDPGWTSRAKLLLSNFIAADLGSDVLLHSEFYSAPVPCLGPESWKTNQIAGERWALIGDAAGFADPITGEGIHFAFKSAQLLAESIDQPGVYIQRAEQQIGRELARASRMYRRFYRGSFLAGDFKKRTIQFSSRSRTLKTILANVIAGSQSYVGLKKKLLLSVPRIGWDFVTGKR
jgi:geranylgeranyl reductase family protein